MSISYWLGIGGVVIISVVAAVAWQYQQLGLYDLKMDPDYDPWRVWNSLIFWTGIANTVL